MKELINILNEVKTDVDFNKEKALIDDEILSSFDIVTIVAKINDEFDIEIQVGNLVPDNFNSIEGMMALIEKLQNED